MTIRDETDKKVTDSQEKNQSIDKSRRGFTRLGAAAPVLMTLASRPVLGANCLSEVMSGNLSDHGHNSCDLGWSPGGWKGIGGEPDWDACFGGRFVFGTYTPTNTYTKNNGDVEVCGNSNINQASCYVGGTTLGDTSLAGMFGGIDDLQLVEILENYPGNSMPYPVGHYIAALLNANCNPTIMNYVMTEQELLDLIHGIIPVPGGMSLTDYLDTTWQ